MNTDKGRQLFGSDIYLSDEYVYQKEAETSKISPTSNLYQENFQKYISYLKEFGYKVDDIEFKWFEDGVWHVNHPLIEFSQINYEKNIGIFDMINVYEYDEKNSRNNYKNNLNTTIIKKLLVVFTFIENEIYKILQILCYDLYDSLVMYGEEPEENTNYIKQLPEAMTARIMLQYKKVYDLVRKLMAYIENLIMQLHCMINKETPAYKTLFKKADFSPVIDLLGRALRAIYVIDCIVDNNSNIIEHWYAYKRLIKLARNYPEKFGVTTRNLKKLYKTIERYENTILSRRCMLTITEITYDEAFEKSNHPLGRICRNKVLRESFELYFIVRLKDINEKIGSKFYYDYYKRLLDLMCVYTLFRKLYPEEEVKDFWRDLWAMQKRIPIIEAHSFVCVYVYTFLLNVCPLSKRPKTDPKDENLFIAQYIASLEYSASNYIVSSYTRFCVWLSRMESSATSNYILKDLEKKKYKGMMILNYKLSNRIFMLCYGSNTILRLNKLIYKCFILHANEQKPLPKALMGKLILGIETLKATAYVLRKKSEAFDTMVLTKIIAKDMLIILMPVCEKMRYYCQKSKYSIHKFKQLESVIHILQSPISELKIINLKYGLGFSQEGLVSESDMKQLKILLLKLYIVAYNRVLAQKYYSCSFLYYCRDILPKFFEYKRYHPVTCKRLQFLFDGLEDPSILIRNCAHLEDPTALFDQFKHHLLQALEENYMVPLKRNLEDFLRINTSAMLIEKLEGTRPAQQELNDLVRMIQLEKIRIFDSVVDIKFEISNSFNTSFYNLNVLNSYDMYTYEIMRVMGNHLFDLKLHDVFLPNQTIEQNRFDILHIVRNISNFVDQYNYNLLSQRFLELTNEGKIISCISIQQLADSIKTHGLGILSTTVDAFHKFLKTKVRDFCKFLYDDQIQNLLNKELKWFKYYCNNENDYLGYYPYERAQLLYKDIKKIGKFEDEQNYLDKFREIITSVGNSLGFIRLLRSASLNTESKCIYYLPSKVEIAYTFYQITRKSTLGDTSCIASRELDELLKSFEDKFSDKIDYLTLMLKAFSKIRTKESTKYLKLFFISIPVLSLNYVEYVARGKEQINKKISSKAFIYDDGFVMGIAYFLTLLEQNEHYRTMHWDDSFKTYLAEAKKTSTLSPKYLYSYSAKFAEDRKMQNQLLLKKLEMMEEEFMFFNYNIVSAEVLFKGNIQKEAKDIPKSPPSV